MTQFQYKEKFFSRGAKVVFGLTDYDDEDYDITVTVEDWVEGYGNNDANGPLINIQGSLTIGQLVELSHMLLVEAVDEKVAAIDVAALVRAETLFIRRESNET